MLKVNEEKIIEDYSALVEKREKGLSAVEADAKAYAQAHGYDEEKTAKFIAFTQDIQGSGLSDKELAKLEVLGAYIEEIEEVLEESEAEIGVSLNGVQDAPVTVNNI